ncbi:hypothetical protein [Paenibacillus sp. CF384]|uniref:hypothetical protein n=1 Tax=Paenibacillus sp. CF384 TaxID=1884382 RepID=UPI00089A2985|nr:hypothetical protein [Paenibacillus sp. CF384]SDX47236.1 hypothetical protein SAMN05518855_1014155 [Paenibacillus sp. CF384]
MKKYLFIILGVLVMFVGLYGYRANFIGDANSTDGVQHVSENENIQINEQSSVLTDDESSSALDEVWFSPDKVKVVESLSNLTIEPIKETRDWETLASNSIDYSADATGNSGGYLVTKDKALVFAPLNNIQEGDILTNSLFSFPLPSAYSNELKIFVGQDFNIVLFDMKNGYISEISMEDPRDSTQSPETISILQTVQLQDISKLGTLKVLKYWLGGEFNAAVIADESNHVYVIDTSNIKVMQSNDYEECCTISLSSNEENGVTHDYLYQINSASNVLRKYDLTGKKEIYRHTFDESQISGKIVKVVSDFNIIYLLCDVDGQKKWYETNEKTWHRIEMAEKYIEMEVRGVMRLMMHGSIVLEITTQELRYLILQVKSQFNF